MPCWLLSKHRVLAAHRGADPLVETASLASIPLPALTFRHSLHDCVAQRLLSDAQLETIVRGEGGDAAAACWLGSLDDLGGRLSAARCLVGGAECVRGLPASGTCCRLSCDPPLLRCRTTLTIL